MRCASGCTMSSVVVPGGDRLKRMPRTPASSSRFSSASVTEVFTTAMPRVCASPSIAMDSTSSRLSMPYVDGCTITLRDVPIRCCSAR